MNAGVTPTANDAFEEIDLRDLFSTLFRWRWLIISVTLAAVILAGIFSFFILTPVYEAELTLEMTRLPESGSVDPYILQLTNPDLLEAVRDKLALDPDVYTLNVLADAVSATAVANTNLITVKIENSDRTLARDIGNTLAQEFINSLADRDESRLSRSVHTLTTELEDTRQRLERARQQFNELLGQADNAKALEARLEMKNGILAELETRLSQSLTEEASLANMLTALEAQLEGIPLTIPRQANWTGGEGPGGVLSHEDANPTYAEVSTQYHLQRAELARVQGETKILQQQIAQLQGEVEGLLAQLPVLQAAEQAQRAEVAALEETESLLREKLMEAEVLESIELAQAGAAVVSPTIASLSPVKPRKMLNMALAGVLGLMLSVMLAFILGAFDATVRSRQEVEQLVTSPVIGQIPDFTRIKEARS